MLDHKKPIAITHSLWQWVSLDHVSDLRKKIGWLSPRCMSDYQTLVIAHKAIQRGEPEETALFVINSAIRERQSQLDA